MEKVEELKEERVREVGLRRRGGGVRDDGRG